VFQVARIDAETPDHVLVEDADALRHGTHPELRVARGAEFPRHDDVERGAQSFRDRRGDDDAASRNPQHDQRRRDAIAERVGQQLARLPAIAEHPSDHGTAPVTPDEVFARCLAATAGSSMAAPRCRRTRSGASGGATWSTPTS
jgi:hypothetical protein